MNISIDMTERDFERITDNSTYWAKYGEESWVEQQDRFETEPDEALSFDWEMIYWVGNNGTAVILAKAYLAAIGHGCQIVWDIADQGNNECRGYAVLTNFKDSGWSTDARIEEGN